MKLNNKTVLTTNEAAELLGLKPESVQKYCNRKQIHAIKFGRDWFITPKEIERFRKNQRPVGRPKNNFRK